MNRNIALAQAREMARKQSCAIEHAYREERMRRELEIIDHQRSVRLKKSSRRTMLSLGILCAAMLAAGVLVGQGISSDAPDSLWARVKIAGQALAGTASSASMPSPVSAVAQVQPEVPTKPEPIEPQRPSDLQETPVAQVEVVSAPVDPVPQVQPVNMAAMPVPMQPATAAAHPSGYVVLPSQPFAAAHTQLMMAQPQIIAPTQGGYPVLPQGWPVMPVAPTPMNDAATVAAVPVQQGAMDNLKMAIDAAAAQRKAQTESTRKVAAPKPRIEPAQPTSGVHVRLRTSRAKDEGG